MSIFAENGIASRVIEETCGTLLLHVMDGIGGKKNRIRTKRQLSCEIWAESSSSSSKMMASVVSRPSSSGRQLHWDEYFDVELTNSEKLQPTSLKLILSPLEGAQQPDLTELGQQIICWKGSIVWNEVIRSALRKKRLEMVVLLSAEFQQKLINEAPLTLSTNTKEDANDVRIRLGLLWIERIGDDVGEQLVFTFML